MFCLLKIAHPKSCLKKKQKNNLLQVKGYELTPTENHYRVDKYLKETYLFIPTAKCFITDMF